MSLHRNTFAVDENTRPSHGGKGGEVRSNVARKTLGDIGNVVGGLSARDSSGLEKPTADGPQKDTAIGQRQEVAALLNNLREKAKRSNVAEDTATWGATRSRTTTFKPRDYSSTLPSGANLTLDGSNHKSITSLLLSRSESATSTRKSKEQVPDIDAADREDPLACTEYVNDIYSYWRRIEPDTRVPMDYMRDQTDINDKMRAILIDWLVEVHLKFKLMSETLFLTTNLIDRFLTKDSVSRKNLQLVGVTAMLLAAKYEEIWAPEVRDFVYISDKAYNRQQILDMEKKILNRLGFNLTVPTPFHFLARYLKAAGADKQCELLATFLTELALPEYGMLKYTASLLSAGAVYAALKTLNRNPFPPALAHYSEYTEAQIRPCAQQLVMLHKRAPDASLQAVHKKYSIAKFLEVAKLPPATSLLEGPATSVGSTK